MLCSLETARAWLGLPVDGAADDNVLITFLIKSASAFLENCCNRKIASAEYDVWVDGTGKDGLVVANYPITAISLVEVDGDQVAAAPSFKENGYRFNEWLVLLRGQVFNKGVRNIHIVYTAGFETVPYDLQQACMEIVGLRYKERDRIGLQSKTLAGETVSFFIKDLSPTAQAVVNQYKRVTPL